MNELISEADRMNLALANVYQDYIDKIGVKTWTDGISSPLLMNVPEEYCRMGTKILFVGQETHTWMGDIAARHSVQTLQHAYKMFDLGKYVKYGKKDFYRQLNSQFWNFLRRCFHKFNEGDISVHRKTSGFLWTNISKVDFMGGSPTREHNFQNGAGFQLLARELEIVQPDIAVLLVGSKYAEELKKNLPIRWERVDQNGLLLVSAQLQNHGGPLVFKTMHPAYLCRIKRNRYIIDLMLNTSREYLMNK